MLPTRQDSVWFLIWCNKKKKLIEVASRHREGYMFFFFDDLRLKWAVGCSYSEFLKHRRYKFFWLDPYDLETFRLLPQAASSVSHRSDSAACVLLPGLTQRQRNVCARHPGNIQYVIAGLTAAVRECQAQFHDQRWNCSSHKHALALPQVKCKFQLFNDWLEFSSHNS